MSRKTKYNALTDSLSLSQINPDNARLTADFMDYLRSTKRSKSTIEVYQNDLNIVWVWNLKHNNNKLFVKWSKRDVVAFQNYMVNDNGNSPARVRRVKATLSSLSNFIEGVLDDEYPDFRNIIHKIESPVLEPVREKTVLTDEQLDMLLNTLVEKGKYEKACMLALAMYSGRRKAELILFKVDYFNDENIVFGSLYKTPERIKTKGRGDGKFLYCYTLAKGFKKYLDLWMAEREKQGIKSEWLFPAYSSPERHITIGTMNEWANSISNILGADFYWHCMRHYYVSSLVRSGLPETVICSILGWSSLEMVRIYNDMSVEEQISDYFNEDGIVQKDKKGLSSL